MHVSRKVTHVQRGRSEICSQSSDLSRFSRAAAGDARAAGPRESGSGAPRGTRGEREERDEPRTKTHDETRTPLDTGIEIDKTRQHRRAETTRVFSRVR